MRLEWSAIYHPEWDASAEAYVHTGLVGWGRSRRLARATDATCGLRAYVGVQHSDPALWGMPGEPRTVFFLSVLIGRKTLFLRTYPTVAVALAVLHETHRGLCNEVAAQQHP